MMLISGAAMLGYCATGRSTIEIAPTTMMMMAITHAKTGLSMKNLDMKSFLSRSPP